MMRMYHGEYDLSHTKKDDILHHEYNADTDTGKILYNNGGGKMLQTEYSGGVDGYKKKANITAIAHLDRHGNITRSDDETPSVLTKTGFSYVDNGNIHSNKENIPAEGNIVKKSKNMLLEKH